MKRRLLLLLAIVVSGALPLSAWADVSLVKTADGTEFKFGISEKMQIFTLHDLDLLGGNTDFRSFISPDTALGDQNWGIQNFANLLFTVERGPLRIHANLEMEAGLDAAAVDVNNINLERMALYYKFPTIGTLAVGMDVHAFDPEGGLIYTDEHPGLWLVGGDDTVSWDLAWHLVMNCNRGGTLFTGAGTCRSAAAASFGNNEASQQNHLFLGRVNINVGNGTVISPLIAYSRRHVPQAELNEFSCPNGSSSCSTTTGVDADGDGDEDSVTTVPAFATGDFATFGAGSYSDQFRPGVAAKSNLGPVTLTGEFVGLLGKIKGLDAAYLGGRLPAGGAFGIAREDFDLRSYALFFEVALDGAEIGMPGLTPYLSFEMHSGDGDPFDDTYAGYVPISNLAQALRKDGFKGQSIGSFGPSTLGASSEDGWGFDVTSRGQGPTLGTIVPDETLGVDGSTFNNRGGKGGNPGFYKVAGGVTGKIDTNVDTHFGFNVYWYNTTEPLEAEAAQNCIARGWLTSCTPVGGLPGVGVADPVSVRAAQTALRTAGIDLDSKYMGFEFNGNVGYTFNGNFRIQPYFSVFVPGDIVEEIGAAYLSSSSSSLFKNKETAFTGGLELSAAF